MDFASYITGFVDGEGCFSISFSLRDKLKLKIEVRPSFSISQHKRNLEILKKINEFFGCGGIRFSNRDQNYKYEVRSLNELIHKIIPHFEKYSLKTSKSRDFMAFTKICHLVFQMKHLNAKHLRDIIILANTMNESGKRKYQAAKLLSILDKMKV